MIQPDLFGSSSFGVDLMYKAIKSTPNDEENHEQLRYPNVRTWAAGSMGNHGATALHG
jgi:hypothetical protein